VATVWGVVLRVKMGMEALFAKDGILRLFMSKSGTMHSFERAPLELHEMFEARERHGTMWWI